MIHIESLFERAHDIGLDGICITDHDTSACKSMISQTDIPPGLSVIVGMEYTTTAGDFLVFGPVDSVPEGFSARDLLLWTRKEGGVAIPAHPFRKSRPVETKILEKCEIVEVINGRNLPQENALCSNWITHNPRTKKGIGGSDAHTLSEIGQSVTLFSHNIHSPEDLIRELSTGIYTPQHIKSPLAVRAV
jgi:predicted metal-dependent phosphoesterase TrpH